jgi:hypothetical protein
MVPSRVSSSEIARRAITSATPSMSVLAARPALTSAWSRCAISHTSFPVESRSAKSGDGAGGESSPGAASFVACDVEVEGDFDEPPQPASRAGAALIIAISAKRRDRLVLVTCLVPPNGSVTFALVQSWVVLLGHL